jgi:hypothetical protein
VIPFLGGCRLAETDRTVARNYITALQEAGRSANTIRQAKVVLGAMFGHGRGGRLSGLQPVP